MIKTLLGIRLRSVFGSITSGKKRNGKETVSKGKILLITLVYIYLIAVFGGLFSLLAYNMAPIMIALGLDWFYFAAFSIIAFAVVFVFSIFEIKSELFECKDNELLLSMPIKPRDIVLSRIFTVLVYNYLEAALMLLPAIIVYIAFGGGAGGIFGSVLMLLFLPLLATALASGIGYLVAMISRKMKHNSFFTVIISVILLILYFWGYSTFFEAGEEVDFVGLSENLSGIKFIGEASMCHPVYTPLFIVISIAVALIAYTLISRSYVTIVTAVGGGKKKKYKSAYLTKGSAFLAMVKKEFSLFFSSATYMLNGAIGIVFTFMIGIMLLIKGDDIIVVGSLLFELPASSELSRALAGIMCAAFVIVASTSTISASALSLEGKRLWIMKTMPVSAKTVLFAKTVPAAVLPIIPNLVASVCVAVLLKPGFVATLLLVLVPFVASIAMALVGTVFNALMPKFNYENEAQVVKQSLAVFLTMMACMLFGLVLFGISVLFSVALVYPLVGMLLMLVLSVALVVALSLIIAGPLSRKFEAISL